MNPLRARKRDEKSWFHVHQNYFCLSWPQVFFFFFIIITFQWFFLLLFAFDFKIKYTLASRLVVGKVEKGVTHDIIFNFYFILYKRTNLFEKKIFVAMKRKRKFSHMKDFYMFIFTAFLESVRQKSFKFLFYILKENFKISVLNVKNICRLYCWWWWWWKDMWDYYYVNLIWYDKFIR